MSVFFFVLYSMMGLAPGRAHEINALAITKAVMEIPVFRDDENRFKTAALAVAVAFRESSFRNEAVGDKGRARCMFQLWAAPLEVTDDPELCARIGLQRLRESIRACGTENPLGTFAAGPAGCSSARAKRISDDRMHLAKQLARRAEVPR